MALLEKLWQSASQALTADGTANGVAQVTSTSGFYSGQLVEVKGTALATLSLKVLEVLSGTQMRLGAVTQSYEGAGTSLAGYTVSASSMVIAKRQSKVITGNDDIIASVYEAQPITALRTIRATTDASFQFVKVPTASVTSGNATITSALTVATLAGNVRMLDIVSSLDQTVGISVNGVQIQEVSGSPIHYILPLASADKQLNSSSTIGVWNVSAVSTTGSICFSFIS